MNPTADPEEGIRYVSRHLAGTVIPSPFRRPGRWALCILAALAILIAPSPAEAILKVYPEPLFTQPSVLYFGPHLPISLRNTWWFWMDVGSGPPERYCFTLKEGTTNVRDLGCEENWSGARNFARVAYGLEIGHTYWVYIAKYVWTGYGWMFYPQSTYFGNVTTTLDGSVPALELRVNGLAEYTNDPSLQIHIDYADATSPPWPASFVCMNADSPCSAVADPRYYSPGCSVGIRDDADGTRSHFDCEGNVSALSDGKVYVCASGADAAPVDNWTGTDQFEGGIAGLSAPACDSVTLDRAAPSVTPSASAAAPTVGQLVEFTATGSDATSGIDATTYSWSFGDNTPIATGQSISHTYTHAGTFAITVTVKDKAGNSGTATTRLTVSVGRPTTPTPAPNPTPTNDLPPTPAPNPTPRAENPTPAPDQTQNPTPTPALDPPATADTAPPNAIITAGPAATPQCTVPDVRRRTVTRASAMLSARRCALGRITRVYSGKVRKGRIIGQSLRPGSRLPRGTRVNVTLSGRRR